MTLQFDIAKHHCREDYDAVNDKHFYNYDRTFHELINNESSVP